MKPVRGSLSSQLSRAIILVGIGVSTFFAVHDFLGWLSGYKDSHPFYDMQASPDLTFWAAVRILILGIAATIALTRFDRRDAKILCAALLGLSLNNYWWWYSKGDPFFWPAAVLNYGGVALGVSNFVLFSSTYGLEDWHRLRKLISLTPLGFFLAMSASGILSVVVLILAPPKFVYFPAYLNQMFWLLWIAANVLIVVASFTAWKQAPASDVNRMAIVAVTFAIFATGTTIHGVYRILQHDATWAHYLDAYAQAVLPIGLGYLILRHRFLDIRFVINQAIVYALLASAIVGIFNLVGRIANGFISSLKMGGIPSVQTRQLAALSASLAVAAALPKSQQWASTLVRSFVFRGRDLDLTVLKRFGQTIEAAATEEDIIEQVADTLKMHGHVNSCCFYLEESDGKLYPRGSTFAGTLPPIDERLLWDAVKTSAENTLRTTAIDRALPEGTMFSVLARSRVRGMLLCGDGEEELATDEQSAIGEMARAAMLAIDDARASIRIDREKSR